MQQYERVKRTRVEKNMQRYKFIGTHSMYRASSCKQAVIKKSLLHSQFSIKITKVLYGVIVVSPESVRQTVTALFFLNILPCPFASVMMSVVMA